MTKIKIAAASAFLIFLSSCLYRQKLQEYEAFSTTPYASESINEAKKSKPMPKKIQRKVSNLESIAKKKRQEVSKNLWKSDFYDFSSPAFQKAQKLVEQNQAEKQLQKKVSLDLLIAIALKQNPALQEAKSNLQATLDQYQQAAFLEEIVFSYQSFVRELNLRVGKPRHKTPWNQRYPFPSTLSLKGEILELNTNIAKEKFNIVLRNLIADIAKTYFHILYLQISITITKTHQKLLNELHKVALTLYESGKTHHSNILRLQVELAKIDDILLTLEQKLQTALASLNQLLSRPSQSPFGPFQKRHFSLAPKKLKELLQAALQYRQELRIANLKANKLEVMVQLVRERLHPEFILGHSYLEEGKGAFAGPTRSKATFAPVIRPMPKWWYGSQEAYLRELELKAKEAKEATQKEKDKSLYLTQKAYYNWDTAWRELKLYQNSLLPRAKQAYQVAKRGYESNRVDFTSLIDAERIWLEFELKRARSQRDLELEILNTMKIVGNRSF
ncbi:MAG: TolC family protein [Planctomycetota bacterium]|nr:MAG: TolC family protein [Planctomycetota bacterium]